MREMVDEDSEEGLYAREYAEDEIAQRMIHSMLKEIFDMILQDKSNTEWNIKQAKKEIRSIATRIRRGRDHEYEARSRTFQSQRNNRRPPNFESSRSNFYPPNRNVNRDFGENQRHPRDGNGHYNRQPNQSFENHRHSNSNRSTQYSTYVNQDRHHRNEQNMHTRNVSQQVRFLGLDSDSM